MKKSPYQSLSILIFVLVAASNVQALEWNGSIEGLLHWKNWHD